MLLHLPTRPFSPCQSGRFLFTYPNQASFLLNAFLNSLLGLITSMEFSRKEYWSKLSVPTPRDLPHPGIEPASHVFPELTGGFFTAEPSSFFLNCLKVFNL